MYSRSACIREVHAFKGGITGTQAQLERTQAHLQSGECVPEQYFPYHRLVATHYLLFTTSGVRRTVCYLVLGTWYLLITTCYYVLLTTYYLQLTTTYHVLRTTYNLLHTANYLLTVAPSVPRVAM